MIVRSPILVQMNSALFEHSVLDIGYHLAQIDLKQVSLARSDGATLDEQQERKRKVTTGLTLSWSTSR